MSEKTPIEQRYGLRPLKPDRIHVLCPSCGRRMANAQRATHDPPEAALIETECPKCVQGGYSTTNYYRADGTEIAFEVIGE